MPSTIVHPAEAARAARHNLGVGIEAPLPDIISTIEDGAGVAVSILKFPESIACAHAQTNAHSFVFANGSLQPDDLRFALAYAYAGCALRRPDAVAKSDEVFGSGDDEYAMFAREFLAPKAAADRSLDLWSVDRVDPVRRPEQASRFARYFGLSGPLALERLAEIDRLDYGGKRWTAASALAPDASAAQAQAKTWAAVDLVARPRSLELTELPRVPARLQSAVLRAYEHQMISLTRLAEILGQAPDVTRQLLERLGLEQIDVTPIAEP